MSRRLSKALAGLSFASPTAYVYDPLTYARAPHEAYLARYGERTGRILMLGMNPGPFGMAQTGVPFGDVRMVRDFLGIQAPVDRPTREHPARPVLGFACPKSEVSGTRLWGFARERFGSAERFFEQFFVANYCPLAFLEESGKNRTPDRLLAVERTAVNQACDAALREAVELLQPSLILGVGGFAEESAKRAVGDRVRVECILHPSPANPRANSGWAKIVEEQLRALGVEL
ncbi:MAG TPA: uracil-DNA glycosylase family protein [Polyangiaceae bacterium]|nr:uracil-DNA glycosylase family protein [Polyangiaceae bacterium]